MKQVASLRPLRLAAAVGGIALALDAASASAAANADHAAQAFARGDFTAARRAYELQANAGVAVAELRLALMLARGQGGPKDLAAARFWLGCALERSPALAIEAKSIETQIAAENAAAAVARDCPSVRSTSKPIETQPRLVRETFLEKLLYLPGDASVAVVVATARSLGMQPVASATAQSVSYYGNKLVGPVAGLMWLGLGIIGLRLLYVADSAGFRLPVWRGAKKRGARLSNLAEAAKDAARALTAPAPHQ